MQSFKDNAGRTWAVAVTVDAVKRVKRLIGVDLLAVGEGDQLLQRLADDPVLLVDVVYAICKPDVDAANLTDEDFGRAMGGGDSIDLAVVALMDGLADFFPKARRAVLRRAIVKLDATRDLASRRAVTKIDAIDVEALLNSTPGGSATSSPPSPAASTRAP
jgi:hypothetical protein